MMMTETTFPKPISFPWKPIGLLGLLLGLWGALSTITSAPFSVEVQDADYFVCYSAAECNAGAGSGWVTSGARNGLSKTTPFACPKNLDGVMQPGDMAIFGDGVYSRSRCAEDGTAIWRPGSSVPANAMKGTASQPIVFRSENKYGAVIDGQQIIKDDNPTGGRNWSWSLMLEYNEYLEFHDFKMIRDHGAVAGYMATGTHRASHHITLSGIEMSDHSFVGISTGLSDRDWTIDGVLIYDIWDDSRYDNYHTCVHQHNIYLNGYNHIIKNSVMYGNYGGTVLTLGGFCGPSGGAQTDPTEFSFMAHVYNNTFDGDGCILNDDPPSFFRADRHRYPIVDLWNRARHNENNSSTNCESVGKVSRNFKNVDFSNNLFVNGQPNNDAGGYAPQVIGYQNAEVALHPSNYGVNPCWDMPWYNPAACESTLRGTVGYLRFRNNVVEVSNMQNTMYQALATTYTGNVGLATAINIVSEAAHNYTPTSSSTNLINNGLDLGITTDFNDNPRDSTPTIGAIEYIP